MWSLVQRKSEKGSGFDYQTMVDSRKDRVGLLGFADRFFNSRNGKTDSARRETGSDCGARRLDRADNGKGGTIPDANDTVNRFIERKSREYLTILAETRSKGANTMTWQRIAVILGFVAAAVAFGLTGNSEMAATALGLAGGAAVPAKSGR